MAKGDIEAKKGGIEVKRTDTIFTELDRLQQAISRRAYELFQHGGSFWSGPLADWLTAEHELVSKPAIEVRQKDSQFEVLAALPGIEAKDLDIHISPDDVLIKAETTHEHEADAGTVHICEFDHGKVFRSVHFPEPVDTDSVKAEYRNGMLRLTASIAKRATAKKVEIQAA